MFLSIRSGWSRGALVLVRGMASAPQSPRVAWFYATDTPKAKPGYLDWVPPKPPSQFQVFSKSDSIRLEKAYQESLSSGGPPGAIPVKEDGLFQVDLANRELKSIYWEGPIYDVRRGTWFYAGSKPVPCPETLAEEIEALYQHTVTEKASKASKSTLAKSADPVVVQHKLKVTEDPEVDTIEFKEDLPTIAALYKLSDSSMLRKIGLSTSSKKVIRGFQSKDASEPTKPPAEKKEVSDESDITSSALEKMESIMMPWSDKSTADKLEDQIKHDYDSAPDEKERVIDHLVLCVHGIGQKLSERVESVNFVHDINVFRKKVKAYNLEDPAANDEDDVPQPETDKTESPMSRVQVLPVLWRHDITFGKVSKNVATEESQAGLTVKDINVEGIPAIRTLVSDVVLDVLLYNDPVHRKNILEVVTFHINKIYREFCKRNPEFAKNPKVSIIGHSLGSVLSYDVVKHKTGNPGKITGDEPSRDQLDFDVSNLFLIGSPLGLFLLINGNKVEKLNAPLYNLFHPSDPVSYRIEPLIHADASKLKPGAIPYTQGGLTTQIQELSQLGEKISRGASSMWNQLTSLYKSDSLPALLEAVKNDDRLREEDTAAAEEKAVPDQDNKAVSKALEKFNPSGRVDYSLQEGVLDISIITAIASHTSYFENDDITSFVLNTIADAEDKTTEKRS